MKGHSGLYIQHRTFETDPVWVSHEGKIIFQFVETKNKGETVNICLHVS